MSCRRMSNGLGKMCMGVCVDCSNKCEVPFKLHPSNPVSCRESLVREEAVKKVPAMLFDQLFLLTL